MVPPARLDELARLDRLSATDAAGGHQHQRHHEDAHRHRHLLPHAGHPGGRAGRAARRPAPGLLGGGAVLEGGVVERAGVGGGHAPHCAGRSRPTHGRAAPAPWSAGSVDRMTAPVTTSLSPMALSRLTDRVGQVLSDRYRLLAPIGTGASAVGVPGRRRDPAPPGGGQDPPRRAVRGRGLPAPVPGRGPGRGRAQPSRTSWRCSTGATTPCPSWSPSTWAGGSLRTMLDQGHLLSPAQALLVGLSAGRGLDYAHRRGFVHRDIKPANLLFDEEARLRIADFGLARALAEAAWTEPQGAVLGTARYASPEQARGETLDGRSDVYSLALVLIETVTGRVPFSGDTTHRHAHGPGRAPGGGARVARRRCVPRWPAAGVPRPEDRPDAARVHPVADGRRRRSSTAPSPWSWPAPWSTCTTWWPTATPPSCSRPDAEPEIMTAPPGTVIDGIRVIPDADERPPPASDQPVVGRRRPAGPPGARGRRRPRLGPEPPGPPSGPPRRTCASRPLPRLRRPGGVAGRW